MKDSKQESERKLVLIGRMPPPIGGVTMHVQRLQSHLRQLGVKFEFIAVRQSNLFRMCRKVFSHSTIHLHTSSTGLQLLLAALGKLTSCRMIITFHGSFGRYGILRNFVEKLPVYLADIPIVLNEESLEKARKLNPETVMMTAFVPPVHDELLPAKVESEIGRRSSGYEEIWCTNASGLHRDRDGKEIYGLSELVEFIGNKPRVFLIISDPSGNYQRFIKAQRSIPQNVLFISRPHSFVEVLRRSDVFIRHTTTDGDSLSVREALALGKTVYATDCVSRPEGVYTYSSLSELSFEISAPFRAEPNFSLDDLLGIYNQ